MGRRVQFFGIVALVCLCAKDGQSMPQLDNHGTITTTTEPSTWDKIKKGVEQGWQVVYDESHCAFHKVKELVKHHDHHEGDDPCLNKPYQQSTSTTPKSIVLFAEEHVPATSSQTPFLV
ncbi:uncharacterized protein [Euwallacea similis]|uniref:uncharacterized protein n=1 Tax=Euwallacea similis TaxID=1736056 RepID=UPI00344B3AA9